MNLGKIPVLETGALKLLDRRMDPVPAGHTLVLFGGQRDAIQLQAGDRTDFDLRRRYPSYALVDMGPSDIEFDCDYETADRSFQYRVTITARVQVANAVEFIRKNGDKCEVGAPFVDVWKTRIGQIVNQHGGGGLAALQRHIAAVEEEMRMMIAEEGPPVSRGIRLLRYGFSSREKSMSVINRELDKHGLGRASDLKLRFPHRAAEIDKAVEDRRNHIRSEKDVREEDFDRDIRSQEKQIALSELKIALSEKLSDAQLRRIKFMIDSGMIDPDEARGVLEALEPAEDVPRYLQGASKAGQKQIESAGPLEDDLDL